MRLLIILPGAIGDFILTLPSILWIRQKLQPSWMELWVDRVNLELAAAGTQAQKVLALAETGVDRWPPSEQLFYHLTQFDQVFSWRGALHSEWRQALEEHHSKIHFLPPIPQPCPQHAMDFRRFQVEALLGADGHFPTYPEIHPPLEDVRHARELLAPLNTGAHPYIMVHPGASGIRKRWPAASFAGVISRLLEGSYHVLLAEGPLDQGAVQEVLTVLGSRTMPGNLSRLRLDRLLGLAALIRHCQACICNDSGIAHLAAATGTPTLAIFTSTDPTVWAPRGPHVRVLVRPGIEMVWEEVAAFAMDSRCPIS